MHWRFWFTESIPFHFVSSSQSSSTNPSASKSSPFFSIFVHRRSTTVVVVIIILFYFTNTNMMMMMWWWCRQWRFDTHTPHNKSLQRNFKTYRTARVSRCVWYCCFYNWFGYDAFNTQKYESYICIRKRTENKPFFPTMTEFAVPSRLEKNVLQSSDSPNEFMIKILSIAFYKTSIQFSLVLSFVLLVASWTKINGIEKKSLSCKESKWFFFLLWGAYESKNGNTNWSTHETMEKFIVEINYSIVLLVLESRVCNSNVLQYRLWILANGDTQQNMAFVHWLKGTKRIVYTSVYIQTTREGEGEREWASVWVSLYGK